MDMGYQVLKFPPFAMTRSPNLYTMVSRSVELLIKGGPPTLNLLFEYAKSKIDQRVPPRTQLRFMS